MAKRQQFTKEFKREVAQLWRSLGRPAAAFDRESGLRHNHLYKRQLELETHGLTSTDAPCRCVLVRWHQRQSHAGQRWMVLVVSEVCAGRYQAERLEAEAREGRKGLWADPHQVPPWGWRKK